MTLTFQRSLAATPDSALHALKPPFQNMSRKGVACLTFLICYAPFCWVLFISENRWIWVKLWPVLPGMLVAELIRGLLRFEAPPAWLRLSIMILTSVAILLGVFLLLYRLPRWRLLVAALLLLGFGLLSWGAYGLYRA